jgi:filamentous hemagglutinin family protein
MKPPAPVLSYPIIVALSLVASTSWGNPVGEQVVAGNATFNRALPGNLTVNQSSPRLIVNWQQFSIARGEVTKFIQPSSSAAVLNRVVTANPSEIYGTLQANGHVYVINPAGILVGREGQIDTKGFVASTLDVANESFMANSSLRFSGDSSARVENQGTIQSLDGDVYLIGRTVENSGTIRAPNGTVGLAAGSEVLLQPASDDRISVLAGNASAPKADIGVNNSGTVEAASAELKAAGGNIYALAINNGGLVRAKPVVGADGRITLKASGGAIQNSGTLSAQNADGSGGTVVVDAGHNAEAPAIAVNSGTISAVGEAEGTKGGEVRILGDRVGLVGNALVDVSGHSGGGKALIGGGFQGNKEGIQNAERTYVGRDAQIRADALVQGDGGSAVVWSDSLTAYYGNISARGGAQGGDGGFAEISGKKNLAFNGGADVSAASGRSGSILLDPRDLRIVALGANDGLLADSQVLSGEPDTTTDVTISSSAVEGLLGNILLQASRDLFVEDALDLVNQKFGETATFEAGRDLTVNPSATIQTAGGDLVFQAVGNIAIGAVVSTGADEVGDVAKSGSITITSTGGSVALNANIVTGDVSIEDDGGSDEQAISGSITVSARQSVTGGEKLITGSATLLDTAGGKNGDDLARSGNISITAGNGGAAGGIALSQASAITIGDAIGLGDAGDTATTGDITLSSKNEIGSGTPGVGLNLQRGLPQSAGTLNPGTLTATTTELDGNILISSGSRLRVGALSTGAGQQIVSITSSSDINVINATENLNGDSVSIEAGLGQITLSDDLFRIGNGSLLLTADSIVANASAEVRGIGGSVTLRPFSPGRAITLGGLGGLSLDADLIDALQDGFANVTIGRPEAGTVSLAADVTFRDNVTLVGGAIGGTHTLTAQNPDMSLNSVSLIASSGDITDLSVVADTLTASADSGITLATTIATLASARITGLGDIDISDSAGGLVVQEANAGGGTVTLSASGGVLNLNGTVAGDDIVGANVSLSSSVGITQTGGSLRAGNLDVDSLGAVTLNNVFVDTLGTVNVGDTFTLRDMAGGLTIVGPVDVANLADISTTGGSLSINGDVTGGGVLLTGSGVSQNASSVVDAGADTITIDGNGGLIDLTGTLTTTSPSGTAVVIRDGGITRLGNISATAGTVVLGQTAAQLGNVSQNGGTAVNAKNLTADTSGSIDLQNVNLDTVGPIVRGGSLTLRDQSGGLQIAGRIDQGTTDNLVDISSVGKLDINDDITGKGVILAGSATLPTDVSVAQNASSTVDGRDGDIVIDGNDHVIDLKGTLQTTSISGTAVVLQDATAVRLGNVTANSGTVALGGAFGDNVGQISQNAGTELSAKNLTINSIGSIDLQNVNIESLGSVSRGGGLTLRDLTGDLNILGPITLGTVNNLVDISASAGRVTVSGNVLGNGVNLTGLGVSQLAASRVDGGSGDILIDGNDNSISLNGTLATSSASSTAVVIRDATTVALGDINAPSGTVVLGQATAGNSVGAISQNGTTLLTADRLTINSSDTIDLLNVAINSLDAVVRGGAFTLRDSGGLNIEGTVTGGTINNLVDISTSGGRLNVNNNISGEGVNLAGVGVSQTAGSTVDAGAGDILIDGNDDSINLAGTLQTTSASGTAVVIRDATTVALGNINATAGTVVLGQPTPGDDVGAISQNGSTLLTADRLTINSSDTINLLNVAIVSLDAVVRGGAFTLRDTGGLNIEGTVAGGTIDNLVDISTSAGRLNVNNNISGQGVNLTGTGVSQAAGSTVNAGSGDILIDGNDGSIDLAGTLDTTSASGSAVVIRDATTVALGDINAFSGTVVLGQSTAGDEVEEISQNAGTTLNANTLTINSSESIDLPQVNIASLGTVVRGGFLTLNDRSGGLTIAGDLVDTPAGYDSTANDVSLTTVDALTINGDIEANRLTLAANGISQGSGSVLNVLNLAINSGAGVTLFGDNRIVTLEQVLRGGAFRLRDVTGGLRVNGPLTGGSDVANLVEIETAGGSLDIFGNITGNEVRLTGDGVKIPNSATTVQATPGNIVIDANRGVLDLDTGSLVTSGAITLKDSTGDFVVRNVTAGTLRLGISGEEIRGNISQEAGKIINVVNLSIAQSDGATIDLGGNNSIATLNSVERGGSFTLNDIVGGLTIAGPITGGQNVGNSVTITTAGGGLAVNGDISGSGVQLTGDGITQTAASLVSGTAQIQLDANDGAIDLNGTLTSSSAGNAIVLRDASTAALGNMTAVNGTVVLGEAGGNNISSDITQNGTTTITADSLTIRSGGSITLNHNNSLTSLGDVVRGNSFFLVDVGGLTIDGSITSGNTANPVDIVTTGGNLAVNNDIAGSFVSLTGNGLTQSASSTVDAGAGSIVVDANDGTINMLGTLRTSGLGGSITLRDSATAVLGNIDAGSGTLLLGETIGGDSLGTISQNGGTSIKAGGLIINSSGAVTLNRNNNIGALSTVNRGGDFVLFDGAGGLEVVGPINGGGAVTITSSGGALALEGDISGSAINLTGQGVSQITASDVRASGDLTVDANTGLLQVNGRLQSDSQVALRADDLNVSGNVTGSRVLITPDTQSRTISLGADVAGTLGISQGDLNNIHVNGEVLRIGSDKQSGNINIAGATAFGSLTGDSPALSLWTKGSITAANGAATLTTPNLALRASSVELTIACNNINVLAARANTLRFKDNDTLTFATPVDDITGLRDFSGVTIPPSNIQLLGNCGTFSISTAQEQLAAIAYVNIPIPAPSSGDFGLGEMTLAEKFEALFGSDAIFTSFLQVPFPPRTSEQFQIEKQSKWTPGSLAVMGSTAGPQTPKP